MAIRRGLLVNLAAPPGGVLVAREHACREQSPVAATQRASVLEVTHGLVDGVHVGVCADYVLLQAVVRVHQVRVASHPLKIMVAVL